MLISRCIMTHTERAILSHWYWMHAFAKPFSGQKRGTFHDITNLPCWFHLIDMECTYFLSQFRSERIIQHQYNEIPLFVLFTCHTTYRFHLWNGVISYHNEITHGVFISRYTIIPQNSYGESFYDITKLLWESLSHVVQWVPHTHTASYFMIERNNSLWEC